MAKSWLWSKKVLSLPQNPSHGGGLQLPPLYLNIL